MSRVLVIGGGIAGCCSALELAKQGHKITILEQFDDILQGTSAKTPGRMGLGYHYFNFETAKRYLEQTIGFMKKYSDCFIGDSSKTYLQHGRYFITKDSIVPLQQIMDTYDKLSTHFKTMCELNPNNQIFNTTQLHRIIYPEEFREDVNIDKVEFAVETKECLLDWNKFSTHLRKEISAQSNITVRTNFKVENILNPAERKFLIFSIYNDLEIADIVINCSWQNIELLNKKAGIESANHKKNLSQAMTSRMKLLAEVKLPPSLHNKNSMFFCFGPHAMFSNLGNGRGKITYAPITNFATTMESEMPNTLEKPFQRWLDEGLNDQEIQKYGQEIISGVAKYIPAIRDARLISVLPGIVKSKGTMNLNGLKEDLSDPTKSFHQRNYSGVEERQIGWIDNAAMKLFYCLGNAEEVAKIVMRQQRGSQK